MSNTTDQLIAALDLLMNLNSGCGDFIHFMKIWVILVEAAPKLKIDHGCLFEFFNDFLFLSFYFHLTY